MSRILYLHLFSCSLLSGKDFAKHCPHFKNEGEHISKQFQEAQELALTDTDPESGFIWSRSIWGCEENVNKPLTRNRHLAHGGGGAGQQSKDLTKYSNVYDCETRNMSVCEKFRYSFSKVLRQHEISLETFDWRMHFCDIIFVTMGYL